MALAVGAKLGPYEIIAAIAKGGMGEVWKARDTRLDRIVAIKFCAAEFSERFGREAKAIAALNHSNICQIYDVGPDYIQALKRIQARLWGVIPARIPGTTRIRPPRHPQKKSAVKGTIRPTSPIPSRCRLAFAKTLPYAFVKGLDNELYLEN